MASFKQLINARWDAGAYVCVGLDPSLERIPVDALDLTEAQKEEAKVAIEDLLNPKTPYNQRTDLPIERAVLAFLEPIIVTTKDSACAFKPNMAFFEGLGLGGTMVLDEVIKLIRRLAPGVPVILDFKRADIDSTNVGSARLAFDILGADAITINPYLGAVAMEPFLKYKDKGIFVLVRTSNEGADEFQDMQVTEFGDHGPTEQSLYAKVARHVGSGIWDANENCGAVVGATAPTELSGVRNILGQNRIILIPGVGAQGGDLETAVRLGFNRQGRGGVINSSRGLLYASSGDDFAEAAGREAKKLNDQIVAAIFSIPS